MLTEKGIALSSNVTVCTIEQQLSSMQVPASMPEGEGAKQPVEAAHVECTCRRDRTVQKGKETGRTKGKHTTALMMRER